MNDKPKKPDMLDLPQTTLTAISEGKKRIENAKDKEYKKNSKSSFYRVKIQDLKDYLEEIGLSDITKLSNPGEYKELHETGDYKQDDILSITPGLQSPPYSRLYASLLSVKYTQEIKRLKDSFKLTDINIKNSKKSMKDTIKNLKDSIEKDKDILNNISVDEINEKDEE